LDCLPAEKEFGYLKALSFYRAARIFLRLKIPIFPLLLEKLILLVFRCVVPRHCEIGEGTELGYGGIAVVIHERAKIGRHVMISPCVTIGGRSGMFGVPVIEDDVFIGAGAKILGDVTIGRRATVGANAVVLQSVPAGAIVAGVPARVIRIDEER
jgi:serine O-acetyltransferase